MLLPGESVWIPILTHQEAALLIASCDCTVKDPNIHGYFVAMQCGPLASSSRRFTNLYGTGFVKIWKTRHKISVEWIRRYSLQCIRLSAGVLDGTDGQTDTRPMYDAASVKIDWRLRAYGPRCYVIFSEKALNESARARY